MAKTTRGRRLEAGRLVTPTLRRVDWSKPPRVVSWPSLDALGAMTNEDLALLLNRWGLTRAWPDMRADAAGYLARAASLTSRSATFEMQLQRLVGDETRRFLLGANRRAMREYQTIEAVQSGGRLIRVTELDDRVCDGCEPLGGFVGTIEEHEAVGMPGPHSCLGGEYCRCELVPID